MAPLNSLNGQAGKKPTSGLINIKRDWSGSQSQSTTNQASQPIEWSSSPERPSRPQTAKASGYDERVARIQAVLESNRQTSENALAASSSVPQKRVPEADSYAPGPVAKKRVLPSSWDRRDNTKQEPRYAYTSDPAAASSSFGSASIAPQPFVPPLGHEATTDVARIFLSNEQQQILKLVEAGNNVFFTGSAGELWPRQ